MNYTIIENKKFINLTPHIINLLYNDKEIKINPSGKILRLEEKNKNDNNIIIERRYELSENIPHEKDCYYIVSSIVQFFSKRNDFVSPDTGSTAIRDKDGHIKAVKNFIKINTL